MPAPEVVMDATFHHCALPRGPTVPSKKLFHALSAWLSCRESQNPMGLDWLEGTTVTIQIIWLSLPAQQAHPREPGTG